MKGNDPLATAEFIPARISDLLADMRQANVSFDVAVAQDDTFFAKSVHERVEWQALKMGIVDAVPDSNICEMCHHEIKNLIHRIRARTAARETVEKSPLR